MDQLRNYQIVDFNVKSHEIKVRFNKFDITKDIKLLIEDDKSFIFNLTRNVKFDVLIKTNAIYDHIDFGPSFFDIKVKLSSRTLNTNATKKTYDEDGIGVLGTKSNVVIIDLEVWKVSSTPKEIEMAIKEEKRLAAEAAEIARLAAEKEAEDRIAANKEAIEKEAAEKMITRKLTNMINTTKILNNITCVPSFKGSTN